MVGETHGQGGTELTLLLNDEAHLPLAMRGGARGKLADWVGGRHDCGVMS